MISNQPSETHSDISVNHSSFLIDGSRSVSSSSLSFESDANSSASVRLGKTTVSRSVRTHSGPKGGPLHHQLSHVRSCSRKASVSNWSIDQRNDLSSLRSI